MIRLISFIIIFSSLFFAGCENLISLDTNTPKDNYNISYGSDPLQTMDIFFPSTIDKNKSAIFLIHGGGWAYGDKSDFNDFVKIYRDLGYITVNLNYRLVNDSGLVTYDSQLDDINSAIQYVHSNYSKYFNSPTVNLIGASAGGHLSLLYSGLHPEKINSIISLAGPTDLTNKELRKVDNIDTVVSIATKTSFKSNPDIWKYYSPINHVKKNYPPTLLVHGQKDPTVPWQQTETMYQTLLKENVKTKVIYFKEAKHLIGYDYGHLLNESLAWIGAAN